MIAIVAAKIIPTGKAAHPWSSDERTFRPNIMLSILNGRNVRSSFYKSHGIWCFIFNLIALNKAYHVLGNLTWDQKWQACSCPSTFPAGPLVHSRLIRMAAADLKHSRRGPSIVSSHPRRRPAQRMWCVGCDPQGIGCGAWLSYPAILRVVMPAAWA